MRCARSPGWRLAVDGWRLADSENALCVGGWRSPANRQPPTGIFLFMRTFGSLTGGGDCPGLNAVTRAAARTLIRDYKIEVVGIQLGVEGLLKGAIVPLTLETIRGILPKGGTLLRTTNRGNPFEYPDR